MDVARDHWYVKHDAHYLGVFPEYDVAPDDLPRFRQDCSFIVHRDSFSPGCYAFESSNFPGHYIRMRDDGYLWIEPEAYTRAYIDAASYNVYEYNTSREYRCFLDRKVTEPRDVDKIRRKLAAMLRGSWPEVQSASLIMLSLMTS